MVFREKVAITMIATSTAVVFIALTYIFPSLARMFLTIEVVMLPSIYMIGSQIIESKIREEYDQKLTAILELTEENIHKHYMVKEREKSHEKR